MHSEKCPSSYCRQISQQDTCKHYCKQEPLKYDVINVTSAVTPIPIHEDSPSTSCQISAILQAPSCLHVGKKNEMALLCN
jgi:hypothetical protein